MPTLTEIRAWHAEHLGAAANQWSSTAELWEGAFSRVAREVAAPPWHGEAADAAQTRANADLLKVRGIADDLRVTAAIARDGERDLVAARQAVLAAVRDAEDQGCVVHEDLSVTSGQMGGPAALQSTRQAKAQALAARIRARASAMVAADNEIAARITAAAARLGSLRFDEVHKPKIQLVDRTLPLQPVPDPTPGGSTPGPVPTAQNIQEAIKDLPTGSREGIRLVRDEAQLRRLEEWVMPHSTEYTSGTPYRGGQGIQRRLADGTTVGFGPSTSFGPTADISLPDGKTIKIHIDGVKGGQMNIPKGAVEALPPVEPAPAPVPRAPRPDPIPEEGGPPLGRMSPGAGPPPGRPGPGLSSGGLMVPMPNPFRPPLL